MKLTKLFLPMLALSQCDAVADVCTVAKIATDVVAGKTGETALAAVCKAAAAVNPVAVAGIGAAAYTVTTVADSYFENQTKQAKEVTKQAKELTKQLELQLELHLLTLLNKNMNGFEYERIPNMDGFRHTVQLYEFQKNVNVRICFLNFVCRNRKRPMIKANMQYKQIASGKKSIKKLLPLK